MFLYIKSHYLLGFLREWRFKCTYNHVRSIVRFISWLFLYRPFQEKVHFKISQIMDLFLKWFPLLGRGVNTHCYLLDPSGLQCTVYSVQCTVQYSVTVYNLVYTFYSVKCTVYSVQCTLYTIHFIVYSLQCTSYSLQYTVYSLQFTVYSVQLTVHSLQCTIYSVQCYLSCSHTLWRWGRGRGQEEIYRNNPSSKGIKI